jgi:hypothetical protein
MGVSGMGILRENVIGLRNQISSFGHRKLRGIVREM